MKPVVLWAVPRSVSTAFERVFVERDDFDVLHEPFAACYYYSDERCSDRFADAEADPGSRYEAVLGEVTRPRENRVFVKDMATHVRPLIGAGLAGRFVNSFIVRSPDEALPSLHEKWPDFTEEEAGYEQLARMYDVCVRRGEDPPVVDAADLLADPRGTLAAYCGRLDIPFDASALTWEPGTVGQWRSWDGWHERAQRTSGFSRPRRRTLPPELEPVRDRVLPFYQRLRARRLRPAPRDVD